MEKKRDLNLDLIRAAAVTMVVAVHFFLNCGFYETPLTGFRMVAATAVRTLLMVCVPLFLLLTGYLRAGKAWSPGYYRGLGPILLTYFLCSLVCLAFRTVYLRETLSVLDWVRGLLHFDGAPYGWYVEMFIGLYLLSPFLNTMWNALEERAQWALLLSVIALTFFASFCNILWHTRVGLRLFPEWWRQLWPIGYYLLGMALRKKPLRLRWHVAVVLVMFSTLVGAALHIVGNWGEAVRWFDLTHWDGPFTAVSAVLLFSAMVQWPVERWPLVLRKGIGKVAELSFAIYLLSYISDQLLAAALRETVPVVESRLGWGVLFVPLSLAFAALLAQLVMLIQRSLLRLWPRRREVCL